MTQDEIIQMVREAGLDWHAGFSVGDDEENHYERLFRMAYAAGHKDGQREMKGRALCSTRITFMPSKTIHDDPWVEIVAYEGGDYLEYYAIDQLEIREPS